MKRICKNCKYYKLFDGNISFHYCDYIECSDYEYAKKESEQKGISIGVGIDGDTDFLYRVYVRPDFGCNRFEPRLTLLKDQNGTI